LQIGLDVVKMQAVKTVCRFDVLALYSVVSLINAGAELLTVHCVDDTRCRFVRSWPRTNECVWPFVSGTYNDVVKGHNIPSVGSAGPVDESERVSRSHTVSSNFWHFLHCYYKLLIIFVWASRHIIQLCRLTLFGHIMRMDDNADAKQILLASPPADWRRQLGRPCITWLSTIQQDLKHHLTLPEAVDLAQNQDDVDVWRYAIVSCIPETTTMKQTYATACHQQTAAARWCENLMQC